MPKIPSKEPEYAQNQFLRHVDAKAAWFGLSNAQKLGEKVDLTGPTVREYRKDPSKMRLMTLRKYISALQLSPFVVLRFLGYSQKDIRKAINEEFTN